MNEIQQQLMDAVELKQTQEEKKRALLDFSYKEMKSDEFLQDGSLDAMKDVWKQLDKEGDIDSSSTKIKLDNEFRQLIRNFNKQKERVDNEKMGRKQKEELLVRLEELKNNDDFKGLNKQLYAIKDDWEDAAYAGKDYDSGFNIKFRNAYDEVFRSKDEHFEGIRTGMSSAKTVKEDIIKRAIEASSSKQWKETSQTMRELMDEWKESGSAGREENDLLWEQFNEARQTFFHNQEVFFENRKVEQEESLKVKKELILEAQAINNNEDIKATSEQMKELMAKWKAAGSSGREHDDVLWEEFSNARQVFYTRQSEFYEERKGKFVDNIYEAIKRRNKQASDLELIVADLEERIKEIRNLDPVLGNQENRWEITNERNQEIAKYQDSLRSYYKKLEVVKDELKELNDKYENLVD